MYDLLNYLKNPVYNTRREPRLKYFLFLFFISFLAALLFGIISNIICTQFQIKRIESGNLTLLKTILLGIILAPISEEILFRSLLRFKKINLVLFIAVITTFIAIAAYDSKLKSVVVLSIILLAFLSLLLIFHGNKIESFISSNFKYFFYATALTFGLLHIFNYTGNIYLILAFSLIIVGPQIVAGFILGFIRMNYGLVYSILFHMAINFFGIILMGHKL